MDAVTILSLILGSNLLVEGVKQVGAGWIQRKRAKREVETERDLLVRSRHMWQALALRLRVMLSERGCEPPAIPEDPWPGKHDN